MKTVLFVFSAVSYYREVGPVVAEFATNNWRVQVLFGSAGEVTDTAAEECRRWGCEIAVAPGDVGYGPSNPDDSRVDGNEAAGFFQRLVEFAKRKAWLSVFLRPIGRLRPLPRLHRRQRRMRRYAKSLIEDLSPDVVMHGAYHSCGQIDNAINLICKSRKIPSFCVPNSPYVGRRALTVARMNHLLTGMSAPNIRADYDWLNRILAVLFHRWTAILADGTRAFYWDPTHMIVAWLNGLMMRRLWLKPSIDFARVFVFSEYSAGLLRADGYPMQKVTVVGQPLLDSVWQRLDDSDHKAELFAYLGLPVDAEFILINVEPAAEHLYCSWESHWQLFNETMGAVSEQGVPVVVSLHPLCEFKNYAFAEHKYGVRICTKYKIHKIYPYCKVSVSFPCSTNLLAVEFNKPLVIFDYFNLTSRDAESAALNNIPGAYVGRGAAEIRNHLGQALKDAPNAVVGRSRRARASEIVRLEVEKLISADDRERVRIGEDLGQTLK